MALDRWIRGEAFDQALDLPTDWRMRMRVAARDAALSAIEALHPALDDKSLAACIVDGVDRARRGTRPDGAAGYFHDLVLLDARLSPRHWRRLIAAARGQQDTGNGHDQPSPSARNRRSHGPKKSLRGSKTNSRAPRQEHH